MDSVQCGHFRTGQFLSCQRILEKVGQVSSLSLNHLAAGQTSSISQASPSNSGATRPDSETGRMPVLPDAVSMAKSLGGGVPIGAFWVRAPYADLLSAGTHGTTYGGSPLACAVALKILEVIRKEKLADNAREVGDHLKSGLQRLAGKNPGIIKNKRGLWLVCGGGLS